MYGRNNKRAFDESLDDASRNLLLAACDNNAEAEIAANTPFSYQKLRARINAEYQRQIEKERWLALGDIWRYAIPAMLVLVIFSFVAFGIADYKALNLNAVNAFNETALYNENNSELENTVFGERQNISSDDVLSTILTKTDRDSFDK